MILPDKSVMPANSLLGVGALILNKLDSPQTISYLWETLKNKVNVSFEKFVLALNLLYILNLINLEHSMVYMGKGNQI